MKDKDLIERLKAIIEMINEGDRDSADSELYALFDEMEFVSDDYEEDDYEDYNDEEEFEEDEE